MFNEMLRSYKFYNPNPLTKLIYFIIVLVVYSIIAIIFCRKPSSLISLVVSLTLIAPFLFGLINLYTKYDKGYSTFIRTIPDSYKKFKNYMIISFFQCFFIYFIIYIYGTVVLATIFNIQIFNIYAMFYTLIITLLFHSFNIILTSTDNKIQFVIFFIIYGFGKHIITILNLGFVNDNNWTLFIPNGSLDTIKSFATFLKSPNIISIIIVVIFLYLYLMHKTYFIIIKKRW